MLKKRALVFSLAWSPFESGGEIAPRMIAEMNQDIEFDVVTYRFDRSWPRVEHKGNIHIYRVGGLSKYDWAIWAMLKGTRLNFKNNYDFVWSIMAAYAGLSAILYKITHAKTPLLLTLQEGDSLEHINNRMGVLKPLFRLLFKRASAVQAISNYLAGWAKEMGYGGTPVVVPNGTDVVISEQWVVRENLENKKQIVLISNSRLERKNGFDIVIKSLKLLPENIVFKNVGDGSERENLNKLSKELGLENRVTLDSARPYEQGLEYLKQGDIFVRPSRSEGLGASFLEAMALGLPIIGTPVGGIPDFLHDPATSSGQVATGIFCEPESTESFAKAVLRLVENPELYEKVRKGGYELMKEKFSWQSVGERMREIFDLLTQKPSVQTQLRGHSVSKNHA